jgi:hypothetical protein
LRPGDRASDDDRIRTQLERFGSLFWRGDPPLSDDRRANRRCQALDEI